MSFSLDSTNSSHKSGWMEGEIVGSKPTWCMHNIPAKKFIVSSVDEFSMQNMYSCFIPYSYRSMNSIRHINSLFIKPSNLKVSSLDEFSMQKIYIFGWFWVSSN